MKIVFALQSIVLGFALGTLFTGCSPSLEKKQPNVILIVSDDQGYADISIAGLASDVRTPNLDRLAESGVRFTNAYATSPICNASRAGLITGNYHQRQGIYWYGGPGLHDESLPNIPTSLSALGYQCGYVGKFHYGRSVVDDSTRRDFPLNHGFSSFFGFEGGRKHYLNHRAEIEEGFAKAKTEFNRVGQSLAQGQMWDNYEYNDQEGFSTELFGEKAREFIAAHREKPFYLHLSFNAVHNFTHQLPEAYLEKKGLRGYRDWDPAVEEYRDWYVESRYPNNPEGRAHYLGQLEYLDTEIGRVLDYLEQSGLREDTIIVYISDNGGSTPIYADNGPLRGSKYTLYEGGIRIPMIISWPGRYEQGAISDAVVSALDLFPTLYAAVSGERLENVDGIELNRLLTGETKKLDREYLVWDTNHETAVRKGKWKLKTAVPSSATHAEYEMVEIEVGEFLYNLIADPGERKDLSADFPEVVAELKTIQRDWRAQMPSSAK